MYDIKPEKPSPDVKVQTEKKCGHRDKAAREKMVYIQ